ncbi:hypothetical protein KVC37_00290 [Helicobacter pylori]|nr:hypothetical protein KVC37_00290 [Helicobacter pylori]
MREELEARINGLENEKTELLREKENLNYQLNASQKQANELKNSQQVLEKEKAELLREKERLTKASTELGRETELERELVCLLSLKNIDKNELDLQNRRFKSEIEDLKRQLKE